MILDFFLKQGNDNYKILYGYAWVRRRGIGLGRNIQVDPMLPVILDLILGSTFWLIHVCFIFHNVHLFF